MVAYANYSAREFLATSENDIFSRLVRSDSTSGFSQLSHKQGWSWTESIKILKSCCQELIASDDRNSAVGVVLEYRIPRREKRLDAAFLFWSKIAVVEFKTGSASVTNEAVAQVSDYCLDLTYYHAESRGKTIVPIVCSTELDSRKVIPSSGFSLIDDIQCVGRTELPNLLRGLAEEDRAAKGFPVSHERWCASSYRPIPGVIETTVALFNKHAAADIDAALADREAIDGSIATVRRLVGEARGHRQKILCLITGVPGAGKTLTGLRIAHDSGLLNGGWRSVFLSGNGPLLKVLRAALAVDYKEHQGCTKSEAEQHAKDLLHSVHGYLAEAQKAHAPPNENIVVFDEAQRAWDAAKMQKMAGRQRSYGGGPSLSAQVQVASEPAQILSIMDRHQDGAVVIALCGTGQEIHDGEAGVDEWVSARNKSFSHWRLVCSPGAVAIEATRPDTKDVEVSPEMHLSVSLRSHRASEHAEWVDAVLSGNSTKARLHVDQEQFPIVLARSLDDAREWLRSTTLGSRRFGLVASSGCSRLRPYGIEVSAGFRKELDYADWFTAEKGDLRSSFALETAATEFECQGLELDRVAVCWGWDLLASEGRVAPRTFRGTKWNDVKKPRDRQYVVNKYRVLLTRAREGMVIWVPRGDRHDSTRSDTEMDRLASYLIDCGVRELAIPR